MIQFYVIFCTILRIRLYAYKRHLTSSDSDRSTFPLASSSSWLWRDLMASKPSRSWEAIVMQARSSLQVSVAETRIANFLNENRSKQRKRKRKRKSKLTGLVGHCLGQSIAKAGRERYYLGMWRRARETGLESWSRIESSATGRYCVQEPVQEMNSQQ